MSRTAAPLAVLVVLLALTGCGGGSGAAATPSVDPTLAQLQDQLDVLPEVDGATRTQHDFSGDSLTEAFTVPAGSPVCLQLLAVLDAGGYEVVAGSGQAVVDPSTCRAADDPTVGSTAGTATILARGGSQIALTWTVAGYTISVTA